MTPSRRHHADRLGLQIALFALVCLIWGLTWIPIKIGVAAIPPLLLAAARGFAAGSILLAIHWHRRGVPVIAARHRLRLIVIGVLSYGATYSLLFWGIARVDSGIAAVVNLSLVPTSLLIAGVWMGEERMEPILLVSTLLGVIGLVTLYSTELLHADAVLRGTGLAAVAGSSVVYSLGAVASRKLLRLYSPVLVAGWVQLVGAACLVALSLAFEAGSPASLANLARPRVFLSWTFLVLFGSVVAFTSYLRLTRDWSPARAGSYAFVSPAIAVVAGIWALDESIALRQWLGIGVMLLATLLVLRTSRRRTPIVRRYAEEACAAQPPQRTEALSSGWTQAPASVAPRAGRH